MAAGNPTASGSRIANATRTWQAAEDTAVTGWTVGSPFVFAAAIAAVAKNSAAMSLRLRWRNVTDGGTFAELGSTGELTWGATTDLVNGNAVATGEAGCTGAGTWVDGTEREGANAITQTILKGTWSEHHFAIDTTNALSNKQYEFELYEANTAAVIATSPFLATLTTAAAAVNVTVPVNLIQGTATQFAASAGVGVLWVLELDGRPDRRDRPREPDHDSQTPVLGRGWFEFSCSVPCERKHL